MTAAESYVDYYQNTGIHPEASSVLGIWRQKLINDKNIQETVKIFLSNNIPNFFI